MKNLIKKSLLMVVLFTTLVITAKSNDANINISIIEAKTVNLSLQSFDGGVDVYIKDAHGVVLFKESCQENQYSKTYNLSLLPNGEYIFEFDSNTKIKTIPFTVSVNEVEVVNEISNIFYKPVLRFQDNKLYVSKLALNKEGLGISIYDAEHNLIYKNKLSDSINLGSILNLSKLESGSYSISVESAGKMFYKEINVI